MFMGCKEKKYMLYNTEPEEGAQYSLFDFFFSLVDLAVSLYIDVKFKFIEV